jgi:hypothetical protein
MNVRITELPRSTGTVFSSLDKKLIRTADGLRGSFIPYAFLTGVHRGPRRLVVESHSGPPASMPQARTMVTHCGKDSLVKGTSPTRIRRMSGSTARCSGRATVRSGTTPSRTTSSIRSATVLAAAAARAESRRDQPAAKAGGFERLPCAAAGGTRAAPRPRDLAAAKDQLRRGHGWEFRLESAAPDADTETTGRSGWNGCAGKDAGMKRYERQRLEADWRIDELLSSPAGVAILRENVRRSCETDPMIALLRGTLSLPGDVIECGVYRGCLHQDRVRIGGTGAGKAILRL